MTENRITYNGIGFTGLLAILFIGLKLGNVITWSWLWVLSPIWIPIGIVLSILIIVAFIFLIIELFKPGYNKKLKQKRKDKDIIDSSIKSYY